MDSVADPLFSSYSVLTTKLSFGHTKEHSECFVNLFATFCENVIKYVKSNIETIFADSNKDFLFLKKFGL